MDVLKGEEAKRVASGRGPLQRRAPSCGIAAPLSELGEIAERRRLADESVSDRKENARRQRRPNGPSEALLRSAQAALTAASDTVPSAEERRAEAAAADVLAASGAGAVAKTAIGVRCSKTHAGHARSRSRDARWPVLVIQVPPAAKGIYT